MHVSEYQEEPWHEVEHSLDHDAVLARLETLETRVARIEARLDAAEEGDELNDDLRAAIEAIGELRQL
jgi:phage shock protein A